MAWSSRFDDPVKLPDGTILRTLKSARDHLPDGSPAQTELAKAARYGGPFLMIARMSVMRAVYPSTTAPALTKSERDATEWKAKRAAARAAGKANRKGT